MKNNKFSQKLLSGFSTITCASVLILGVSSGSYFLSAGEEVSVSGQQLFAFYETLKNNQELSLSDGEYQSLGMGFNEYKGLPEAFRAYPTEEAFHGVFNSRFSWFFSEDVFPGERLEKIRASLAKALLSYSQQNPKELPELRSELAKQASLEEKSNAFLEKLNQKKQDSDKRSGELTEEIESLKGKVGRLGGVCTAISNLSEGDVDLDGKACGEALTLASAALKEAQQNKTRLEGEQKALDAKKEQVQSVLAEFRSLEGVCNKLSETEKKLKGEAQQALGLTDTKESQEMCEALQSKCRALENDKEALESSLSAGEFLENALSRAVPDLVSLRDQTEHKELDSVKSIISEALRSLNAKSNEFKESKNNKEQELTGVVSRLEGLEELISELTRVSKDLSEKKAQLEKIAQECGEFIAQGVATDSAA